MGGGSSEDVALVGETTFDKKKFFLVWSHRLRQEDGWEFETSLAIQ